ncbi:MAG TPA: HAMP domain-containing sensor histidine kinase [Solirubrobacterales bacterium]|nr:HAMP domain-containing sensor histidine kinase [Solirubrobacterales bacterium]
MRSGFRPPELSLRTRLVVTVAALAAVGLAALSFVSYRALHSYLYERVDQQLQSAVGPVTVDLAKKAEAGRRGEELMPQQQANVFPGPLAEAGPAGEGGPGGGPGDLEAVSFGQLRYRGRVIASQTFAPAEAEVPLPALPAGLEGGEPGEAEPFTAGQRGGGSESFRVLAVAGPAALSTVVAIPLGDTDATLDRLAVIELVVSSVILLAIALLAWWLVGLGLRPLRRMGETADQIAAGDLSRRVEPANGKTEVGRLGLALNGMLAQIEGAFAERAAGERRLRRFLADASHELRTPLAAIRGYAELFGMGAQREPEQVERAMGRIEAESTRMGGLVDDLLTLARLDEVKPPAREPVALGALLDEACEDARAAAPQSPISLRRPAGDEVEIEGDADQLRRLLDNLLRNAVVHTPERTAIDVSLAREGGEAVVGVRDHGAGIAADDPQAVFERFWRSSSSRGRDDGGAGLGLAIVAAIAHAHGGEVSAANAPDGGAEFTLRLPVSQGLREPASKLT